MTFVKMAIITIPSWQAGSLELGQKAPNLPPLKNITKWPCQLTPKFKNDYLLFSWCPTQSGEWRFHFFYGGPSRRKNITTRAQMCWTYFHFVFGVFQHYHHIKIIIITDGGAAPQCSFARPT